MEEERVLNRGKDSQERHRRYLYQESEIAEFQRAFKNKEKTLARFNIKTGSTLDKIMERNERRYGESPNEKLASNPVIFDDTPSCYEGIVRGIYDTIFKLKTKVSQQATEITELRQEINNLRDEKRNFWSLSRQKEMTIMQELLNQIKVEE